MSGWLLDAPLFPPTDLAWEWADEWDSLIDQVQKAQKPAIFVVKALSKDNGADDVGCDGLEDEGGVQGGSWRRIQDKRQGIQN